MVEIAFACPEERAEIARFMQEAFPRAKWDGDGWRRLLDGRWSAAPDRYAITARDGHRLIGVLGLVTARRPTGAGPAVMANMTSWYLLKPYRAGGIGGRMIRRATDDPDNPQWAARLVSEHLPTFNERPVDSLGGGDALLSAASLALSAGASVMTAAYLGNAAAAIEIGKLGNKPVDVVELRHWLKRRRELPSGKCEAHLVPAGV